MKIITFSSFLLKNAKVLDFARKREKVVSLFIQDGKIVEREERVEQEIDLNGKYLLPGFIDLHCHLREPGREDEETIETGSLSALKGGFTKICCMPNTEPPLDNQSLIKFVREKAKMAGFSEVLPIGCATKGRKGEELAEIRDLVEGGAVAVSDDGEPIRNPQIFRLLLEYTRAFNIPVIDHCEEKDLNEFGVMNEGEVSFRLGLKGIPDVAEAIPVFRDLLLADKTKGKLHLAHITTAKSCRILSWAKKEGISFSAETCPHYFTLTDSFCATFDPNYKVNPPLRPERDLEAIKEALAEGLIDCIATDHAPHNLLEKRSDFVSAPFGIIGFETAFSLSYEELVLKRYLSIFELVEKLTRNPAKVLGIKPPEIKVGEEANLVIFDPKRDWVYTEDEILSKSKNTPFLGRRFKGKIEGAIVGNKFFQF